MAPITNIELCEKCSDDPGTLYNMQMVIIPEINKEIDEAKYVIFHMFKGRRTTFHDEIVYDFKNKIVENVAAKRKFYARFPELPRVKTFKETKKLFDIP
jgi:hypothetical protein